MTLAMHKAAVVFSLTSYDASTSSLKSLSLASRSSAYASSHRVFRVLKPVDVRDIEVDGSFVHTILQPGGWRHAYDVRSITIVIGKLRQPQCSAFTSEQVAARILNALPHLQHVKLVPDQSYASQSFEPVANALVQLERLESLDLTDFHASALTAPTAVWSHIAARLRSLCITINQADRVENRRNPVFRTILANASQIRALALSGIQSTREIVELLAVLQRPEELRELRICLKTGQNVGALAIALNRLERIEELSIAMRGGFESVYFLPEQQTFGRAVSTECLGRMGINLNALHHLHLTCDEGTLVSMGLGCVQVCTCEKCVSGAFTRSSHSRWVSTTDKQLASSFASTFYWGMSPPISSRCDSIKLVS